MTQEPYLNPHGAQRQETSFDTTNDYEKGLKLAEAGQHQEALNCMQEYLQTAPDDAQAMNDIGAILYCLGRSDEAIDYLVRALNLKNDSAEIIWNLVEVYLAAGRPNDAAAFFDRMEQMRILNPDILNRTANVFLNQNNKGDAIEMLLRSLQICENQEILKPMIQIIRSKRPKLAFFCGGDGMQFLDDIIEFLQQRFDVRVFEGQTQEELYELMKWSDISWFEWCTNLAVIGSKQPKTCKNIIRLHRYEAYEPWVRQVNWNMIDVLLTVGNSFVKDALLREVPYIESQTSMIHIPNGVNLEKFPLIYRQRGKNIAFLSNLRSVKNPAFVLQCMQKLHYIDPEYRLFFGGRFQDHALEQYMRHMIDALHLRDVVFFDGWQPDVHTWLKDKHYIVSTSIIESQGMALLEAMASGLKPVIHNFPGASQIFPSEHLFNIAEEFCEQICSNTYEPEKYRRFVEQRYAVRDRLIEINHIFTRLECEIDSQRPPTPPSSSTDHWKSERPGEPMVVPFPATAGNVNP